MDVCQGWFLRILKGGHFCKLQADKSMFRGCSMHDAAEAVRASMDEECDNVARLSAYFGNVVLTHWQAAVLYARAYPHAAHVMVRIARCTLSAWPLRLHACMHRVYCFVCSTFHDLFTDDQRACQSPSWRK